MFKCKHLGVNKTPVYPLVPSYQLPSMASLPPAGSLTAQPGIKWLIVDSSPLLTSPLSTLRGMALQYLITPDVVLELRDKRGREVLREAEMMLLPQVEGAKGGFAVREPTFEAIAKGEYSAPGF